METIEKWVEKRPFLKEVGLLYKEAAQIAEQASPSLSLGIAPAEWEGLICGKEPAMEHIKNALAEKAGCLLENLCSGLSETEGLPERFREGCRSITGVSGGDKSFYRRIIFAVAAGEKALNNAVPIDSEPLIRFLAWNAVRACLKPYVGDIAKGCEKSGYDKPLCPVCGKEPPMAYLKKAQKGRRRYLICGCCGSRWLYKRIGCPYCGNSDQKTFTILETEQEPGIRADVCGKCGCYIKTVLEPAGPAEEEWAWLHIDILCSERGLKKRGGLLDEERL